MTPQDESETAAGRSDRVERRIIWFHPEELVALRMRGDKEQKSEAAVVREAVRRHLGLEKRTR
jgi:hypothetical protein